MAEYSPVRDLVDYETLDSHEVYLGYQCGLINTPEPGNWASRSLWHGWRNGRVEGGHAEQDRDQVMLRFLWDCANAFGEDVRVH